MNNTTNAEPATAAAQGAGRGRPSVAATRLEEALLVAAAGGELACARRNVQYAGRPEVPEDQCADKVFVLGDHANEIVPGLYLGSGAAAAAPMGPALRALGVAAVVNCTNDHEAPNAFEGEGVHHMAYVRVAVRDEDGAWILPYLAGAADFIDLRLRASKGVLVHCQRGVSRSASVAGLLTQGVPGVPQDPFAPPSGPQEPSPDSQKRTENPPGTP
jgi:hypothetical protein